MDSVWCPPWGTLAFMFYLPVLRLAALLTALFSASFAAALEAEGSVRSEFADPSSCIRMAHDLDVRFWPSVTVACMDTASKTCELSARPAQCFGFLSDRLRREAKAVRLTLPVAIAAHGHSGARYSKLLARFDRDEPIDDCPLQAIQTDNPQMIPAYCAALSDTLRLSSVLELAWMAREFGPRN